MTEKMRESLSALMDGESNELELQRILSGIGEDTGLRETWVRYHAVREVVSGGSAGNLSIDFSRRVREALVEDTAKRSAGAITRLLKPVASFAVAASVAAVVVVGGQQIAQMGESGSYSSANALVAGGAPVGLVNSIGATTVRASYGAQGVPVLQPAARTAYRELARQRMQKYMQEHAEHAALNSPQGLVPFARVQKIEE